MKIAFLFNKSNNKLAYINIKISKALIICRNIDRDAARL